MGVKYTTARHHFSAIHTRKGGGPPHGHTWQVQATWIYTGQCAEELLAALVKECGYLTHTTLPDELSREEDIAEYIGLQINAWRVDVWRAPEALGAYWQR